MFMAVCLAMSVPSDSGFPLDLAFMSAVVVGSSAKWASPSVYGLRRLSRIFSPVAARGISMKKTSCELNKNAPFEGACKLDTLFKTLADGQMPNFLEVMAALSEISYEVTTDCGPCLDCRR